MKENSLQPSHFILQQFSLSLEALKGLIAKARQFAQERKFDENLFLSTKMAPDMFPFVRQVQIICDTAKGSAARLSGNTAPVFADDEKSMEELIARIDKTLQYIKTFKMESFSNYEQQKITFPWNPGSYLNGHDYLVSYALPNFYFHLTIAYALLRTQGVAIGKGDYLGKISWQKH